MNGFVGILLQKNQKLEKSILNGPYQNYLKENGGLVVGRGVYIEVINKNSILIMNYSIDYPLAIVDLRLVLVV